MDKRKAIVKRKHYFNTCYSFEIRPGIVKRTCVKIAYEISKVHQEAQQCDKMKLSEVESEYLKGLFSRFEGLSEASRELVRSNRGFTMGLKQYQVSEAHQRL